jgi:hypothetical protein
MKYFRKKYKKRLEQKKVIREGIKTKKEKETCKGNREEGREEERLMDGGM